MRGLTKRQLLAALLTGAAGLAVSPAGAESPPRLRFVEETNWPPFTPNATGLTETGLSYDLVREVARRIGADFQLELFPQNRALQMLKTGERDGITVISKNAERDAYLLFSDPIFQKRGLIYFDKARLPGFAWSRADDLAGRKIGVVRGHNYGDELEKFFIAHADDVEHVTSIEQNFQKLALGRIDLLLCIEMTAAEFLRNPLYGRKITAAARPYYEKDYHIAFSKLSPAARLLPRINAAIAAMKADETLPRLIGRHVS